MEKSYLAKSGGAKATPDSLRRRDPLTVSFTFTPRLHLMTA